MVGEGGALGSGHPTASPILQGMRLPPRAGLSLGKQCVLCCIIVTRRHFLYCYSIPFYFIYLFIYFVFLPFLGPLPRHMAVPRPGVQSEL